MHTDRHFTYDFQARALYERNGYELAGRVEDFPPGTDVLWDRKRLNSELRALTVVAENAGFSARSGSEGESAPTELS